MRTSTPNHGKVQVRQRTRCAIYTRKSTEEGLHQEFNSLDAQRESAESYIASQKAEGWVCLPDRYDDGGYTGGNIERPALTRLISDIEAGRIDCVVVYKVDRLSRSLLDFARLMETFEAHHVSFVSVTQQFSTTSSMGRLTLNILLSFAQFEREIISERTRDKIAAARRKGKWMGGKPLLGYDLLITPGATRLVVNEDEAVRVRAIFDLYVEKQSLIRTCRALNDSGWTTKRWTTRKGHERGGHPFDKTILFRLLTNVVYVGRVRYRDEVHAGEHEAIVDEELFDRAQRMLRSNGRNGGAHLRNKYGALLMGLLRCKPCDRAMGHTFTAKGHRRYRYYTCHTALKEGWQACPSKSIPAEQIERFVVERIKAIVKDPTVMALTLEQARSQALEEAEALERDVNTARDELVTARGSIVTREEVGEALTEFAPLWDALSPREQARVVQLLIQRVDYDGANGKVAITFRDIGIGTLAQGRLQERSEEETCATA